MSGAARINVCNVSNKRPTQCLEQTSYSMSGTNVPLNVWYSRPTECLEKMTQSCLEQKMELLVCHHDRLEHLLMSQSTLQKRPYFRICLRHQPSA